MQKLDDLLTRLLAAARGKAFLAPDSFGARGFRDLVEAALLMKQGRLDCGKPLAGKTVALAFFNPSLRTRASMAVAVQQLGGFPLVLDVGGGVWGVEWKPGAVMNGDKAEHLREMIPVLAGYADMLAVRAFPQLQSYDEDAAEPILTQAAALSKKPLLSLESAMHHPCQALADMLTLREKLGSLAGKKVVLTWAYHPKALPLAVPNSFAMAAALSGMDLTITAPQGFGLDPALVAQLGAMADESGGRVTETNEPDAAWGDADAIYVKSWSSFEHYGKPEDKVLREANQDWMFDEERFAKAPHAKFMHCLPVRRNVEVADGVLDSPRSIALDQAENRLHGQKALIAAMALANEKVAIRHPEQGSPRAGERGEGSMARVI